MLSNEDGQGNRFYDLANNARSLIGPLLSGEAELAQTRSQVMANIYQRWLDGGEDGLADYVAEMGAGDLLMQITPTLTSWATVRNQARRQEQEYALAVARLNQDAARYGADLAARPRNLVMYGAWLKYNNLPVNGLTVAMAAQRVPDAQLANLGTSEVSGFTEVMTREEAAAGRSTGGSQPSVTGTPTSTPTPSSDAPAPSPTPSVPAPTATLVPGTVGAPQAQGQGQGQGQQQPAAMAPTHPTFDQWRQGAQTVADMLRTTSGTRARPEERNALGLDVGETHGSQINIERLNQFTPSQIQAKASLAESRRGANTWDDILQEARRAAPKGVAGRALRYA